MPCLPADVWPAIARATLAAEGDGLAAWLRISMVSRTWRDSVADVPVMVEFHTLTTPQQQQWLHTTRVRERRVAFHADDAASAMVLQDQTTLAASESTLEEAEGVFISADGPRTSEAQLEPGSMTRFFTTLRSLWLRQVNLLTLLVTPGMPPTLRELVLDAYPGSATEQWVHVPHVSEVGALSMLTRLELCGHTTYNSMFRRDVPDMPEAKGCHTPVLPASLRVLRMVPRDIRLLEPTNFASRGSELTALETKTGDIGWYRGLQVDGLVGYLAAGYGEVRLAARDLHLLQEDDGQRWQWFEPLDPRPAGPAEALVDWLQAAPPSLRRLQLYIHAEEDHRTGTRAEQRPPLRLHYRPDDVDVDYDDYDEPICNPTQELRTAAELFHAVREYAANHAVDVALDDSGRCIVFDRC